jgi:uncharacterized membrane protein YedE/YeeE
MQRLSALLAGLLFGAGLALSGMVNPMKVQNFLDLFGTWDPTLIFVMGAGLAVTFIGYRMVLGRGRPLYADRFSLPETTGINSRLIGGSVLFGAGWGLTGFCPGPAIASLVFGLWPSVLFVAAMSAGMLAAHLIRSRATSSAPGVADG